MLIYFLQGLALALPSTISPSPFKIFLISQALEKGARRTLPAVLAPLITDGPIIVLVMLVLTQTPEWFLTALRLVGGLYLFYLAARMLLNLRRSGTALQASAQATRQSLAQAIVINVFNPNPYLLWSVIAGPLLLESWRQSPSYGLSLIGGFYLTFICGLAALVVAFATVGKLDPRLNKALLAISAVAFIIIGANQILAALTTLLGG